MDEFSTVGFILGATTLMTVSYLLMRVIKAKLRDRSPYVPPEVRDTSHAVANRATEVQAQLRWLGQTDDPLAAFVKAVRKTQSEGPHGSSTADRR